MSGGGDEESWERALADLEIVQSAYPDEIQCDELPGSFPLKFTFHLPGGTDARITMCLERGYPDESGVGIDSYRSKPADKSRMETVVSKLRSVSEECRKDGIEGCIMCCSTALETWQSHAPSNEELEDQSSCGISNKREQISANNQRKYHWAAGETLTDRKSAFQAFVCRVSSEREVHEALEELLVGNSKLQRASHNMVAWRVSEVMPSSNDSNRTIVVKKHDNNDDGEHGAGSKLAYLLELRKDDNVVVVVSRWFGGIHLGPKRFAHIVNVARELLVSIIDKEQSI